MKNLKEAVAEGTRRKDATELAARKAQEQKTERDRRGYELSVKRHKAEIKKDGKVFDMIADAIAKGEKEVSFRGTAAFAEAINSFPGLTATHNSGYDFINSDEVKESWESVTVTWKP